MIMISWNFNNGTFKNYSRILCSRCHFVFVYHDSNIAQHKMLDLHIIDAKFIYISRNSRFNGYNNNMRCKNPDVQLSK